MSEYIVRVYDTVENNYSDLYPNHFDNRADAIEYAIDLTKGFIDAEHDYLECDVFVKDLGMDTYQMIGYVNYSCDDWDYDNLFPKPTLEFVECFN